MLSFPIFILMACCGYTMGANILGIVPMPAKSHNILFQHLMISLANAGHNVTHMSMLKLPKKVPNLTEIELTYSTDEMMRDLKLDLFALRHSSPLQNIFIMPYFGIVVCEEQLKSKEMQDFLVQDNHFDVIIAETFLTESVMAGLSYKYKAPLIAFSTIQPVHWVNLMVGNLAPTSIIPDFILGYHPKMNFIQRFNNLALSVTQWIIYKLFYLPRQDDIMRRYFGEDLPPIEDIVANTSLVFTNDHLSLTYPRPLVPNVIPIGGVHVAPPKELPKELKTFLDKSESGAILFSLGSNLKSSDMSPEKIEMFINAFSKLKQNVLWKFEADLPNNPPNVMLSKWLPQSDILAHPNIRVFVTHGGLLSTTEAVVRGVPVVGIPIFGDQPMNMKQAENAGFGLSLNFDDLTSETLANAIETVLTDPKYRESVQLRSALLKDQPLSPIDSALFWTDYVIRHKGAPHLRSNTQDLYWFQAIQLDTAALLVALVAIFIFIIFKIIFITISCCFGKKENVVNLKNKNK